jgi:hypothetical protein
MSLINQLYYINYPSKLNYRYQIKTANKNTKEEKNVKIKYTIYILCLNLHNGL